MRSNPTTEWSPDALLLVRHRTAGRSPLFKSEKTTSAQDWCCSHSGMACGHLETLHQQQTKLDHSKCHKLHKCFPINFEEILMKFGTATTMSSLSSVLWCAIVPWQREISFGLERFSIFRLLNSLGQIKPWVYSLFKLSWLNNLTLGCFSLPLTFLPLCAVGVCGFRKILCDSVKTINCCRVWRWRVGWSMCLS